jgi:predicted ATP-dependent endonuclease of OLD family
MHISRLEITNFRNFGEPAFVIALKPFTLLLGENNVGKSNLLAAVSLLFGQELSSVQRRILDVDDLNHDAVVNFKKQVANESIDVDAIAFPEVVVRATLTDISDDQHPVIGDWYTSHDLTEARVTYTFSVRGNFNRKEWLESQRSSLRQARALLSESEHTSAWKWVDFPISEYRHLLYGGDQPSQECDPYFMRMLRVEILDALRDAERELVAGGENRLLYRVLRQSTDSRHGTLKASLQALETAVHENPALSGIKTEVAKLLQRVSLLSEDEDHSIGLQFSTPEAGELLKRIGMTYGAHPMSVARNGLGRNNLLYVALMLSQIAKSSAPTPGDDTHVSFRFVGIEEPEAHLHPHLQDHLAGNIEDLRKDHSGGLQLVLTSHSTHVAARLQLANTAVLFRSDVSGQLSSHYVLDGIDVEKDKDAVRFLSLYLDATKSRMLFARRLLLVEGIAEQALLPVLFEQSCGQTLESIGCTILNVNGVAFRHFLAIVRNGFFKKCVVLTDADTGTKFENRAAALRNDFSGSPHIQIQVTELSTFEKDLIHANSSGAGKEALFEALCRIKPLSGPSLRLQTGANDIAVEAFFSEIERYKAEFAFSLASHLRESSETLSIPKYIEDAFNFLRGSALGKEQ